MQPLNKPLYVAFCTYSLLGILSKNLKTESVIYANAEIHEEPVELN